MILVTDANIFIDLEKIGLLEFLDNLNQKFATSDFVFNELNSQQQALLSSLDIERYEIDVNEIGSFYQEFSDLGQLNISYQDYSIFYHAKKYNGVVLSNDKRLRNFAKVRSIPVKGLFYIIDEFIIQEIVTPKIIIEKLKLLKKINCRLPLSEIDKRIKSFNEL